MPAPMRASVDEEGSRRGSGVDLLWIPLGAGRHVVRLNGKAFEALTALLERRPPLDLYHAALEVAVDGRRYVIELAPVPDGDGQARGVVGVGPVGSKWLGRLRIFRYEVRRWPGGAIPDRGYAVGGPRRVTADESQARRVLDLVPAVPKPVWGRDELDAGEMWNSNSVIAWLLVAAGIDMTDVRPPEGGRAPGWDAGLLVARRDGPDRDRPLVAIEDRVVAVRVASRPGPVAVSDSPGERR